MHGLCSASENIIHEQLDKAFGTDAHQLFVSRKVSGTTCLFFLYD